MIAIRYQVRRLFYNIIFTLFNLYHLSSLTRLVKKRLISLFLLLVFAINFAHSVLAHRHGPASTISGPNFYFNPGHSPLQTAYYFFQHGECCTTLSQTGCSGCQCSALSVEKGMQMLYAVLTVQQKKLKHFKANNVSLLS